MDDILTLAKGGLAKPSRVHSGAIRSHVAGRTDHLPMHLESGAYVIPADIISAMGEGNTEAGFKVAKSIFSAKQPKATGGPVEGVPIVAAGGEYVIDPASVMEIGGGDMDTGHKALDAFVLKMRKENIKTLRNLDPPKKD